MGDFNDEPFNVSLTQHALSTRQRSKVLGAISAPLLWNLMGPVVGADDARDAAGVPVPAGTFYFQNFANVLDQFLVGKNMIGPKAALRAHPETVAIVTRPAAMIGTGTYPAPVPLRRHGQGRQRGRLLRPLPHHHASRPQRIEACGASGSHNDGRSPLLTGRRASSSLVTSAPAPDG
jgi:hypothetical protein